MANLLDTIRNNTATPQQGVTDETQKLQTLLRAKSGKQLGAGSVASSNLGEQAAVAQTNQQLQNQVAPQTNIQNQQLAQQQSGIQQQEQLQKAEINQTNRLDTLQTRLKTDQILKDLERSKGEIDLKRDGARLEQLGSNLRLQNKQYVDNLQREGQLARLNDDAAFRQAALQSTMGQKLEILNKTIDNNTLISANDREFKRKVAQIDVSQAYAMFNADMAAGKDQAMWGGIGNLAKAGISAYGAGTSKSTAPASTEGDYSTVGGTDGDYSQFSGKD